MDHRTNKRYKKLRIKRNQMPNKISIDSSKFVTETLDDEENFKIKRFMKDVKKFCGQPPTAEETDHKASGDCLKVCKNIKEKIAKIKEKGDGFNTQKNNFKEKYFVKREGLFQRGVMTKGFNTGLMPPSLTARINEDLQKMIELANGNNFTSLSDSKSNEENAETCQGNMNLLNQEICDSRRTKAIANSPNCDFVETEVQVDCSGESNNHRTKTDLYLQFTHFVTRSLFNSGIDKQEMKKYSDSIKESLVETYRSRLSETDVHENVSSLDFNTNIASHLNRTPSNCSTLEQLFKTSHSCPSTTKAEGLKREKFTFANDSQLSDDIVIRKPAKTLYTSGLDYLKAVYSGSSDSSKKYLTNAEMNTSFSPIQHDSANVSTFTGECYSTNNLYDLNNVYNHNQVSQYPFNNLDHSESNRCNNNFSNDTTIPLQYFPGNSSTNRHSWNRPSDTCTYHNTFFNKMETETNIEQPLTEESPKYISLLPPNHRFYSDLMTSLYSVNSVSGQANLNEQDVNKTVHHTLLSLPVHPAPRKSPDIQYIPRKMF